MNPITRGLGTLLITTRGYGAGKFTCVNKPRLTVKSGRTRLTVELEG